MLCYIILYDVILSYMILRYIILRDITLDYIWPQDEDLSFYEPTAYLSPATKEMCKEVIAYKAPTLSLYTRIYIYIYIYMYAIIL